MTEMNENNFNDIRSPEENPGDQTRKAPEKPNSSSKRWGTLIGMGAVFGLVAGGVMWGVNTIGSQVYPQRQIAATETLSAADSSCLLYTSKTAVFHKFLVTGAAGGTHNLLQLDVYKRQDLPSLGRSGLP